MSFRLPKPTGQYDVGSVACLLADGERPAHLASQAAGRQLVVKAWYPSDAGAGSRAELLWEQLRDDSRGPLPMRLLLKCVRSRTSTSPSAPFTARASSASLVLYNHGLVSFASENTTLMERLASHGHVVLSIQHVEQLAELKALGREQSAAKRAADARSTRQLQQATREQRPQLAREFYAAAANTNRIVVERAKDAVWVLDRAAEILDRIPAMRSVAVDTSSAHLIGFSVGGAVSTQIARHDPRARTVVNLDGGLYGDIDGAISQPYLMMYSSANDGINDLLLPSHAVRVAPPGTRHLNYHDVAMLMPWLRMLRATGTTDARAFIEHRNETVQKFLAGAELSERTHVALGAPRTS